MAVKSRLNEEVLAKLGVTKLAELVLSEAQHAPAFRRGVTAALAAIKGPDAVAAIIDRRLAALERARGFIECEHDYGSLYGMGSYYGEDYTASILVRLGTATQNNVATLRFGKVFAALSADQQASAATTMREMLQGVNLTNANVILPDPLARALSTVRDEVAKTLNTADPAAGWTPAYSLSPALARQTVDFLVYSSLTTVARRPGLSWSWTEN